MTAAASQMRAQVLQAARWLCEQGFFGGRLGSGGNVSARVSAEDLMVITPSQVPYKEMQADDICVLDLALNPVAGSRSPSIEAGMHAAVYHSRPDTGAVVHTHSVYASVLTLINRSIPALFDEITLEIGPAVELIPYAPSGSRQLAENLTARLKNGCACYLIQNHGAVSLGPDLTAAMRHAELLEKVAKVYVYALSTGEQISRLPESAIQYWMEIRKKSIIRPSHDS